VLSLIIALPPSGNPSPRRHRLFRIDLYYCRLRATHRRKGTAPLCIDLYCRCLRAARRREGTAPFCIDLYCRLRATHCREGTFPPSWVRTRTMSDNNDDTLRGEEEETLRVFIETRKRLGLHMDVLTFQARFEQNRWTAIKRACVERQRYDLEDFKTQRPRDYTPPLFINNNDICWLNSLMHVIHTPSTPPPCPRNYARSHRHAVYLRRCSSRLLNL
jgi:hypothetical protein